MYSDGLIVDENGSIFDTRGVKIRHVETESYNVLIGCAGDVPYGSYVRTNFVDELEKVEINDWTDDDKVVLQLTNIFTKLWHDYCDRSSINYKEDYGCDILLVVNGNIYTVEMLSNNLVTVLPNKAFDYSVIGQESSAATSMLDYGFSPEDVIKIVAKRNIHVNDIIKSIKNIKWQTL